MRQAAISGVTAALLMVLSGCGYDRVKALAESDEPLTVAGVDGPVCLVKVAYSSNYTKRGRRGSPHRSSYSDSVVIAAPGTSVVFDGGRDIVAERTGAWRELARSTGWTRTEAHYAWSRYDADRAPPSAELLALLLPGSLDGPLRADLLMVLCDGNRDCANAPDDLASIQLYLHVIRCGDEFMYPVSDE